MQSHSSTTDTPCLQCFSCYVITGSIQLNKLRPITACLPSADHHNAKCQLFRETHFLTNSSKTDSKSMTFARLYASSSICIVHFKKTRGFAPRLDLSRGLSRCTLSSSFPSQFRAFHRALHMNRPFALRVNSTRPWMITSIWCYYCSSEDIDARQP